jgi:hypothetical protein
MGEVYSTHGKDEKCTQNVIGKFEVKRLTGKSRYRWEDNTKKGRKRGLDASGSG